MIFLSIFPLFHDFPIKFPTLEFHPSQARPRCPVVAPWRGMSGADLANLLNEGAIVAARQNKAEIDADDIANALDDGWMGKMGNRIENLGYVTHMLHV